MAKRRNATEDYFARTDKRRRATSYDEVYTRHTYRIQDETHESLRSIAERNGIGLNELIRWLLARAIAEIAAGTLVLPVVEYKTTIRRLGDT